MIAEAAIDEVAAQVPASLATYRDGVAAGPGGAGALPLASLRDPAVFDRALTAFCTGRGAPDAWRVDPGRVDRCALVSYWSQFYLAVLATPALTAVMRLGRPLPLAFEATSLELDAAGRPCRLLVQTERTSARTGPAPDKADLIEGLVEGHLRPFVEVCRARCGLAPRVIWGNAAVILDYVAGELDGGADPGVDGPARAEVAACLGWRGGPACARSAQASPLTRALCPDAAGCRRRRACCLRHRLPGVPSCGALCPLEHADRRDDR